MTLVVAGTTPQTPTPQTPGAGSRHWPTCRQGVQPRCHFVVAGHDVIGPHKPSDPCRHGVQPLIPASLMTFVIAGTTPSAPMSPWTLVVTGYEPQPSEIYNFRCPGRRRPPQWAQVDPGAKARPGRPPPTLAQRAQGSGPAPSGIPRLGADARRPPGGLDAIEHMSRT